jgi:acetoin utilization deacetylase AcuC-like enzyme
MHFVYSPDYQVDIGEHVFPIQKYTQVACELRQAGIPATVFVEPPPATREQLLRVHAEPYLDDLDKLRWSERTVYSELPLTSEIVGKGVLTCGGTIRAAELALAEGTSVHIGGGFHHAFADKAEGFCYLNDLAVAARAMQVERGIAKIMVIDCDLHQGNGTAKIFEHDETVFTFSIHQKNLYPLKQKSDLDIHLPNGVRDNEYLEHLRQHIPAILDEFQANLVLYQAGVDPYEHDQLGDLKLTMTGLAERDRMIFQWVKERGLPIVTTLGGGYAYKTSDTVKLHVKTCLAAWEIWGAGQKTDRTGP